MQNAKDQVKRTRDKCYCTSGYASGCESTIVEVGFPPLRTRAVKRLHECCNNVHGDESESITER